MKMTLIDWAIVFAVGNVVFGGLFIDEAEDPYMYAPVCNTVAGQPTSVDPRCLNQTEDQAALTALPHQTPPAVVATPQQSGPSPGIAATN